MAVQLGVAHGPILPPTSGSEPDRTHGKLGSAPFKTAADRALALALTLLPFVRPMIKGPTPLHVFTAPTPGTGKGLCALACLMPGFGDNVPAIPEIKNEDEMMKQLGAIFLAGRPLVFFDNVRERVDSASLSMALTQPVWQKRILGVSRDMIVTIRCVWVMTGNNVEVSGELGRRTPHVELDVETVTKDTNLAEYPWRRTGFRHPDLLPWARAHRGELIHACLTIIQSWQIAGRPDWSGTPLGSYESWSRVMGGLIEHVGGTAFLTNLEETYDKSVIDRDRECDFVTKWAEKYGVGVAVPSETLLTFSIFNGGDPFALLGSAGRAQSTSFGKAMSKLCGSPRCGLIIERAQRPRSAWQLRRVGDPKPTSDGTNSSSGDPKS